MTDQRASSASPSPDAAAAFEGLRREISLQRAAIEGLTAAKDKLPDYSPTLRDISSRLDRIDKEIESINDKPAMRLTPETLATRVADAATNVRAEDRNAIGEAREALARSLGRVEGMIKQKRSNSEQDWWVTWAATGGALVAAFVTSIVFQFVQ
ncbi:MAG TPA: DUF6118 family protein [Sphingopyxis sp.]|nr:DUF6118 family protein [Sphingopyxis sp.]